MKRGDVVTVSVLVEAEPTLAFEVFTNDVDTWWRRGIAYRVAGKRASTMRFEPGVGGRLIERLEEPSPRNHVVGRILAWQPGVHLAFEFRGPNFEAHQKTRVDVRFKAEEYGTRVTVEHGGWATLPPDHPVRHKLPEDKFYSMWGQLWNDQTKSLRFCVGLRRRAQNEPHEPERNES